MVKKILNLVLYSNDNIYDKMYNALSNFYKRYAFIDTVFYVFDDSITKDYEKNGDILKIKGSESSLIPGVLDKTIKAFLWVNKNLCINDYSYIVRSNISTIIEFNKFKTVINENPFDYGSFLLFTLDWIDKYYGTCNDKYFGTKFASGTNIILQKNIFLYILNNIHKLDYSIIDDISIGVLVKNIPNIIYSNFNTEQYYTFVNEKIINKNNKYYDDYIVFRNKNNNRYEDIERLKHIIFILELSAPSVDVPIGLILT